MVSRFIFSHAGALLLPGRAAMSFYWIFSLKYSATLSPRFS